MSDDLNAAPAIPEAALRYLQANPQTAAQFDSKFGAGRAAEALQAASPGLSGTLADMGKGVVRGAIGAVNETIDAVDSAAKWAGENFGDIRYTPGKGVETLSADEARARNNPRKLSQLITGEQPQESALFTPRFPNVSPTDTTAGQLTEGVSQFVTGLAGLGKLTKLAKLDSGLAALGKIGDAAVRSATVSSIAFDPYEGNLANFVERYPTLQNPVTDFLAVGDDDSEAEARLKNALADVVGGVPIDLALKGLKALRAKKQGRLEDAEKHLESLDDGEPKEAPAEAPQGPQGTPTDTPWVKELVEHVTTRGPREESVAEAAVKVEKADVVLPQSPVRLADDVALDLAEKMKETVRTLDGLDSVSRTTGADPWRDFFAAGHDFNVQKILSTGGEGARGALTILEDIGETFRPQIDEARGGATRSFETVRASAANMARMTGNDPGEFLALMTRDAKSMKTVEARLYAYKNFTLSLADNVKRLAQMLEQGTHGTEFKSMDEVRAQFAQRAEFLANVQAMTKAVQSGTARAVSAGRLGARMSPAMTKAIDDGKFGSVSTMDAATIDRMAKAVAGGAPEEVLTATRLSLMDRASAGVYRYWINSILSGPATHIVNATSNFVKGGAQAGEEYLAGVYSGNARQRAVAARTFAEMGQQTVEAWRVARKALNQGDNILDPGSQVAERQFNQVSAEELSSAIENGQYGAAILRAGNVLFNYPTRLLASEDEFFKQVTYRSRVAAKAQVDGSESGLVGKDLQEYVDRRLQDSLDADGGALDEDALAYARETTFTTPLEPGSFSANVQMIANSSPWMRMVLPFVKTPANVLYDWAYRSGAHFDLYRDLSAGGERRAMAAARLTTGAAFYSTAALLVNSGAITGMGPQDTETKRLWKAAGNQPYSVKVGDQWIAYNRMDPFGMFFGIAADIGELANHVGDREMDDLGSMALVSFSRNLSNKSYLRGLADVMDALFERGDTGVQKVQRVMQSYASGFVPFSGYVSGIKDDPMMREVRSMADAVANRVPGFSESLDPQRNVLGEITMASEIGGISPWAVTKTKDDGLGAELVRIYEATGEKLQRPPKKTGDVDWSTFTNSKGRSAYDRFLALHSELGLRKAMQGVMKTPGWDRLSDAGRVEQFRNVLSRVRSAARLQVFKEFPDLRDQVMEQERLQRLGMLRSP